ncbi:hypothetical protein Tco_0985352 [Tanacetum coccineum]
MREGSQISKNDRNPSERPKMLERLKNNDENVFGRLGHRRQSVFERLSDTYSPSTTKSGPERETLGIVLIIEVALTDGTLLTKIVLEAETAPTVSKNHMRAASAMEDNGSQRQKGTSLHMNKTLQCPGHVKRRPRGSRENFPSRSTGGTLGNAYVVSYVQFYPNRGRETKEVRQRSSGNPQYQVEGWRDHRGFHKAIQG